jgi:hypothetical protein
MGRTKQLTSDFKINNSEVSNTLVNTMENVKQVTNMNTPTINCLRNEKIIVRHIFKKSGLFDNPKHVFAGGMAENATRVYTVPRMSRTGELVNVLTNDEKNFLEDILGLPMNALSIYKKGSDNFWSKRMVRLGKEDNIFDLSKPQQYIDYKILLANTNSIAPSLAAMEDKPKSTYEFVIINENDETKKAKQYMSNIQRCYKEFGKIEDDADTLRLIVETITGRPTSANTKLDWLQTRVNDIIQGDNKTFLKIVTDVLLPTKVLIKKSIESGIIQKKNNLLYMGGEALCEYGEESTLNNAAKYLNNPKHQDVLFSIQANLK